MGLLLMGLLWVLIFFLLLLMGLLLMGLLWAYFWWAYFRWAYYVISSRFFWMGLLLNYILCSYVCLKLYVRANKIVWRVFFFVFSCMWMIIWALLTEATLEVVSPGAPGAWWWYLILWQSPAKGPRSPHTGYIRKHFQHPKSSEYIRMSQVSTNVSWS